MTDKTEKTPMSKELEDGLVDQTHRCAGQALLNILNDGLARSRGNSSQAIIHTTAVIQTLCMALPNLPVFAEAWESHDVKKVSLRCANEITEGFSKFLGEKLTELVGLAEMKDPEDRSASREAGQRRVTNRIKR